MAEVSLDSAFQSFDPAPLEAAGSNGLQESQSEPGRSSGESPKTARSLEAAATAGKLHAWGGMRFHFEPLLYISVKCCSPGQGFYFFNWNDSLQIITHGLM